MEEEDAQILKEGTVDYVGLSYYMTNAVKADHVADGNGIDGFPEVFLIHMLSQVIGVGR